MKPFSEKNFGTNQWVTIQDVPTKIVTWGKRLDEPFSNKKEVILFITGNPGLTGFYLYFLAFLHNLINGCIPIYLIGHAGHNESERRISNLPPLRNNKSLYSLDGQVQHKVEFIRQFIPNDVKITLIAHSIGSYIALRLFKIDDINQRIRQCCLLFPTFEYMASAPNGKIYMNTLQFYFKILYYGAKLLDLFPRFLRAFCVQVVLWMRNIPSAFTDVTLMLVRPSVLSKIVFMADGEMDDVLEPDYTTIEQNKSRLRFIYSTTDGWTPATYYHRLKAQVPDVKAHLTDRFEHTFTLKSSYIELADCLAPWVLSSQAFPEERL